ncbi:hypothetical protein [Fusobacterium animalis]
MVDISKIGSVEVLKRSFESLKEAKVEVAKILKKESYSCFMESTI